MVGSYWMGGSRREGEGKWLAATGWEAVGGRGRGGEVVGSYWMGGNRREGEGRGSGWQLLDGRQEEGGGGEIRTYTHQHTNGHTHTPQLGSPVVQ